MKLEPWRNEAMQKQFDEADDPYRKYAELRKQHGASAGFYIDAADYFMEKGEKARALRVLSNVSELRPDDAAVLRIHAHRAAQYGALDLAIVLFEVVRDLRPEEPQSHRDLALLLARKGEYARAIELLEDVVLGDWNDRFPEIELIALGELNDVIADCQRQTGEHDSSEAFLSFESFNEPDSIYRLDLVSGERSLWARPSKSNSSMRVLASSR